MLAKAGNRKIPPGQARRAMACFVRTIRLLNANHIRPLIVIMPYQPRVLSTFLSVGSGESRSGGCRATSPKLSGRAQLQSDRLPPHQHLRWHVRRGSTTARTSTPANSRRLLRYLHRVTHPAASSCRSRQPRHRSPSPSPSASPGPGARRSSPGPRVHAGAREHEHPRRLPGVRLGRVRRARPARSGRGAGRRLRRRSSS